MNETGPVPPRRGRFRVLARRLRWKLDWWRRPDEPMVFACWDGMTLNSVGYDVGLPSDRAATKQALGNAFSGGDYSVSGLATRSGK